MALHLTITLFFVEDHFAGRTPVFPCLRERHSSRLLGLVP
jgi:hypothetical protein